MILPMQCPRSRVRAMYAASLGVSPRWVAQVCSLRIAVDCLARLAWTTRSRHSTRPCRHRARCDGASQPRRSRTSMALT